MYLWNNQANQRAIYHISSLFKRALKRSRTTSWSQCGEDLVISYLLSILNVSRPSYLDIGAHHPTYLSNTYLFYKRGCRGVCVEPDPKLFRKLQRGRKGDICINAGAGADNKSIIDLDFYVMSSRTLNTFSREEAARYQKDGKEKIEKIIKIPILPVNGILSRYFNGKDYFISLDVEGLEVSILKSIDFSLFRPSVLCIETLTYATDGTERKIHEIEQIMRANGYITYADTYINTIFVESSAWERAKKSKG